MKVAIHQNKQIFSHSTSWSEAWIKYCEQNKIDYDVINCYDTHIIEQLTQYDILLWHISHHSYHDMIFARDIIYTAQKMGVKTFPDFDTLWHFDNKIAQSYLLKAMKVVVPDFWAFFILDDAIKWIKKECVFPVIAKLKSGSGSMNVKLIKNRSEAISYSKKMFSSGFNASPNPLFKISSNVRSSKSLHDIIARFKRIPDFLQTLKGSSSFPNEKKYLYFQEFIPNNGFDLKIVTVGDKLSFIARNIRKNDFRASGGGDIFFDRDLVDKSIIESAFEASNKLGVQCMGYDYVVDKGNGIGKIVEMSYGFSHKALLMAGGYWDKDLKWHDHGLNAPHEVLKNLISCFRMS